MLKVWIIVRLLSPVLEMERWRKIFDKELSPLFPQYAWVKYNEKLWNLYTDTWYHIMVLGLILVLLQPRRKTPVCSVEGRGKWMRVWTRDGKQAVCTMSVYRFFYLLRAKVNLSLNWGKNQTSWSLCTENNYLVV